LKSPEEAHDLAALVVTTVEMFSGPVPPPTILQDYENVSPGGATALIEMARKEQSHHHLMENLEMLFPYFGLGAGFVGLLSMTAGAVYLGAVGGSETVALALIGANALGAIGWFIKARNVFRGGGYPAESEERQAGNVPSETSR
jgi:uncharacterized membrane protein